MSENALDSGALGPLKISRKSQVPPDGGAAFSMSWEATVLNSSLIQINKITLRKLKIILPENPTSSFYSYVSSGGRNKAVNASVESLTVDPHMGAPRSYAADLHFSKENAPCE